VLRKIAHVIEFRCIVLRSVKTYFFFSVILGLLLVGSSFGQCPPINVIGPAGVTNSGDEMTFRVDVGSIGPKYAFEWSVSNGVIVRGQRTPEIAVATDRSMAAENVTATVVVAGLQSSCPISASETAPVAPFGGCGAPIDEWSNRLKVNDQRGRLDAFFTELANNPKQTGFIFLQVSSTERLDSENRRLQLVRQHAKFRRFDIGRIWFGLEVLIDDEPRTKVYRLAPGSEQFLPCDRCLIIKGDDLK
jgi:hypothetical protein